MVSHAKVMRISFVLLLWLGYVVGILYSMIGAAIWSENHHLNVSIHAFVWGIIGYLIVVLVLGAGLAKFSEWLLEGYY